MTPDLDALEAVAKAATQGEWKLDALGGSSTVICSVEPVRNGSSIAYAYQPERGYCIARPFLFETPDSKQEVRFDFVTFSHGDAKYLATFQPRAVLTLIAQARAAEALAGALGGVGRQLEFLRNAVRSGNSHAELLARVNETDDALKGALAAHTAAIAPTPNAEVAK